jgi:hypothetical protein
MESIVSKSVEYVDLIEGQEYNVKVFIISAPEEMELDNIDMPDNKGFIFKLLVSAQPSLTNEIFDASKDMAFIIGIGEETKMGYIEHNSFIEIDENDFLQGLGANVLEVLMIEGNTGSFKQS